MDQEQEKLKAEIKQLNSKLSMYNLAFMNLMDKNLDGIIIIDEKKIVLYANIAAIQLFNCPLADLLGNPLKLDINPINMLKHNAVGTELHMPNPDRPDLITTVTLLKTEWNGKPSYLMSFRDITEQKKSEEALNHISHYDPLTDLPNRAYFEERLNKVIKGSNNTDQYTALLYLDLDNFKIINDTLGHEMGDCLIKAVSVILQQGIRRGDIIGRLGGDEFALVLRGLRKPDYAATVANTILNKLGNIFNLKGREVYTNASIGIAIHPFSGATASELIKNADAAMYAAKKNGKNQYHFYSSQLNEQNKEKLMIYNGLRNIVNNKELFLEYQPIMDLSTSTCCGIEALVRWQHPQLGLVSTNQFLSFAEETGMMLNIGYWVIQHALKDYKQAELREVFLSINLSTNELDSAK